MKLCRADNQQRHDALRMLNIHLGVQQQEEEVEREREQGGQIEGAEATQGRRKRLEALAALRAVVPDEASGRLSLILRATQGIVELKRIKRETHFSLLALKEEDNKTFLWPFYFIILEMQSCLFLFCELRFQPSIDK